MTVARSLQVLAAVAVLAMLWAGLDGATAARLLSQAQPEWLLAALAALTLQTVLSALRWQLTAGQLGQQIPLRTAVAEYYLAQVVNQSLPGGVLGDAGRAVRARHAAGLRRAGAAVAIERMAGQLSLLLVLSGGVVAVTMAPGGLSIPTPLLVLLVAIVAGALAVALAIRWSAGLSGRAGRRAQHLRDALSRTLLSRRALPRQAVLNLAITTANLLAFAACARATGTRMEVVEVAVLVPLILLTMILPLTISGWGLREGAAAALFPIIGASASAGLAASLAFGLVFLASTSPGLLMLLARQRPGTGARRAGADG
ncbi:lysylphosphatidylglycerol synthase transmembrane domain-containing protein [Paracoccus beibuensis]|uniref:lysylphosphatidylglycerol synthase transmembrane domain-containing protein n=1 Tax=Paracoccus beibuensis TaxID=547602 RepID=UPI00223EAC60|nr:lysylphosphatidylglycerol synthase transmembrane domain-containing protein [Paracoccus beibuensis]